MGRKKIAAAKTKTTPNNPQYAASAADRVMKLAFGLVAVFFAPSITLSYRPSNQIAPQPTLLRRLGTRQIATTMPSGRRYNLSKESTGKSLTLELSGRCREGN